MDLNYIPEKIKKIHLIAACGTGMGALACALKDMGFKITGSDHKVYPPMSTFLAKKGINIADGFDEKNILYRPDLIIVGNAVTRNNPEALKMLEMELPFCSMPQAINRFLAKDKQPILITGTHGKTTTSALTAWILYYAGLDPSFFIGGILKDFNGNFRAGKGASIVIEGDEYDTAFFDKGPKFLHYDPFISVVTSIEFDHADIFKDIDHVKSAFAALISRMNQDSTLIAFDSDQNIAELCASAKCRVETYGRKSTSFWQLANVHVSPPWNNICVTKHGKLFANFRTKLIGEHNMLNALAAIAIADRLSIPTNKISDALEKFQGVRRRQDVRGIKRGIVVIDDFAHHPTAVKETLRAVRLFYPQGRLFAVFEPRTNTSMRTVFQDVYPLCFDQADIVCIRKPSRLDKIPPDARFSSEKFVDDLKYHGKDAYHFSDTESIIDFLVASATTGDIILIMSNGGFDNIHERLLERL